MVLARDSTGKLWMTYIADNGQVMINRTVGDDLFWGEPFALPADESQVTTDDGAQVFAYGPARVGVLWSNQGSRAHELREPPGRRSRRDLERDRAGGLRARRWRAGSSRWSRRPTAACSLPSGRRSTRTPTANGRSPQVLLLDRDADGDWSEHALQPAPGPAPIPVARLRCRQRDRLLTATTPKPGGTIVFKRTSADHPSFDAGSGTVFIADSALPSSAARRRRRTRLDRDTGFVMLAWDPTTARYVHGIMDLGRGVPTLPRPAKGYAPVTPQLVFKDDFDPFPVGSRPLTGWVLRVNDPPTAYSIVARPSKADRSASVVNKTPSGDIRACKAFPDTTSGDVTVDVKVRLSRLGASDAVLTEVRGSGPTAASVRLGKRGFFEYFRGATKVITTVRGRPGFWYRSIVVVHLKTRTFDWKLLNATGRVILGVRGVAWRDRAADVPMDRVCLKTPTGGAGIALDWDDISVVR